MTAPAATWAHAPAVRLVALEALVAAGAWAGTVGFATGSFDSLVERLPFSSRTLGAVALAVCIAVPTTATAVALLQRRTWAAQAALLTAGVLAVWLVGQTAFVGLSAFQPAFLAVAAGIAVSARRLRHAAAVGGAPRRQRTSAEGPW